MCAVRWVRDDLLLVKRSVLKCSLVGQAKPRADQGKVSRWSTQRAERPGHLSLVCYALCGRRESTLTLSEAACGCGGLAKAPT